MRDLVNIFMGATPASLPILVKAHIDDMDAAFFTALQQSGYPHAEKVARLHLQFSSATHLHHLELIEALFTAKKADILEVTLAEHTQHFTSDFLQSVLHAARYSADEAALSEQALALLDILAAVENFINSTDYQAETFSLRCGIYLLQGKLDAAEKALLHGENSQPSLATTHALKINAGLLLYHRGQVPAAITHYQQLLPELQGSPLKSAAVSNLAMLYTENSQFGLALQQLQAALNDHSEHAQLAKLHGNLTHLYRSIGNPKHELHHLQLSLEHAQNTADTSSTFDRTALLTGFLNRAQYALEHESTDSAESWLQEFKTAAEATDANLLSYARIRVELYTKQGQLNRAINIAQQQLSQPNAISAEHLALMGVYGQLLLKRGDNETATHVFTELLQLATDSFPDMAHESLGYLAMIDGQKQSANTECLQAFFDAEQQLRAQLPNPQAQFRYSGKNTALFDQLITQARNQGPNQVFERLQQIKARALTYKTHDAATSTFYQLSQTLAPDELFLELYLGDESGFWLICTADAKQPVLVPLALSRNQVLTITQRFEARLSVLPHLQLNRDFIRLAKLAGQLLDPIRQWVMASASLIIATNGPALSLPWAALPWPSTEQTLIQQTALSFTASASVWLAQYQHRQTLIPNAAWVGYHHRQHDTAPLRRHFTNEAQGIAKQLNQQVITDIRPDKQAELAEHTWVHLCCHGRFDTADPLSSGLLLATEDGGDRWCLTDELQAKPGAFWCLTGCETGRAEVLAGDEQLGVLGWLTQQQVSGLLLSRWPIPADHPASIGIIEDFYRYCLQGQRKAIALQQAILNHAQDANPYNWAGYYLIGC